MAYENREQQRDVIFLFGAGASVDAGIPDTYQFVELFKSTVKKKDLGLYKQLLKVLEIREGFNKRNLGKEKKQVDVEQLLDTLEGLIHKNKEVLLDFYQKKVFNSSLKEDGFSKLKKLLEEFIREKVVVEEEKKLEYLKELLKFDTPLEIYSVNYDTCIEQLSHISHMRYTDGFDTYWNRENFDKDFDVKHHKMHGSIIWYENKKTKEYVKIPVHAFTKGKQVGLRLIYGEDVEPLLVYPAQKPEYIEPLTELQLMFKGRLVNKDTKILVVVGYSFRDDYLIHMLWDAGRINDDLHIILVDPKAQEHFEKKLQFIDKDKEALSRVYDRVVCLPYPFSTVIYQLKNYYLTKLRRIFGFERGCIESEKAGGEPQWEILLRNCIDCEFLTKAERILKEKIRKRWVEIPFDFSYTRTLYGVRAMLHSVIAKDDFEDEWLTRVNESLRVLSIDNLQVSSLDVKGFILGFEVSPDFAPKFTTIIEKWVDPVLNERNDKLKLLSTRFEKNLIRTEESFKRWERFRDYLARLQDRIEWKKYLELRSESEEIGSINDILSGGITITPANKEFYFHKLQELVLNIERRELEKVFEGKTFQFQC